MSEDGQLGRLLLRKGLISPGDLDTALGDQSDSGAPLSKVLIDRRMVTEAEIVEVVASQLGMHFVDLAETAVDPTAAELIPVSLARRYEVIPYGWADETLLVAMVDPSNVLALDDVRSASGCKIRAVIATSESILEAIDKNNRLEHEVEDLAELASGDDELDDLDQLREVTEDKPVVKLANLLITQAVQDRASDIHIEPTEHDVCIRYRIDGVLHEVMRSPKNIQRGLISRIKIMAEINIAERRVPQDGRISLRIRGKAVDLRVATLPTVHGEKVVMRILDTSTAMLRLQDLGFIDQSMHRYEQAYNLPYGTILVTGPTGSGKSTTLYATLNQISDTTRNVITVEDPVEYRLPGINQVQVNKKAGLTFSGALRSILRCDPDIVLVGEIRDTETAVTAMEAALTGHLVLSTLHTNDAASAPTRLIEMGLQPYLVSSALDCIVAQRLVRLLCDRCKTAYEPSEAELEGAGWNFERFGANPSLYRHGGCGHCGRTGYHGRIALHEVLSVTDEISSAIAERTNSDEVNRMAIAQGMLTLRDTGLHQVLAGLTSLEEILRVVA
ncbi:MAG: GspE/PulE family protein [Acidimicrobiales bacterium]